MKSQAENDRCDIRRAWILPRWDFGLHRSEPANYPRLKDGRSCILNFSTHWEFHRHFEPMPSAVARDLMRRLALEMNYDSPPICESAHGEAWLMVESGKPIGCVTVGEMRGGLRLVGAWVHPDHRRRGVMTKLWECVTEKHGALNVAHPSPAMREWMTVSRPAQPSAE